MSDYLWFWLARAIVDNALQLIFLAIGLLVITVLALEKWVRQSRCRHDGRIHETQACEAICTKCGKNLGFIGAWRKRNA
nr:MAG TPA: zinc-ribbon containing domain protein [Caudoviricetes sp.]